MKRISILIVALALAGCGSDYEPSADGIPDIRGINLADAHKQLKKAGYEPTVVEDDAAFGVIVESNFTVCDQEEPRGKLVPVKVAKRGC